jgi:hypothetical protein
VLLNAVVVIGQIVLALRVLLKLVVMKKNFMRTNVHLKIKSPSAVCGTLARPTAFIAKIA